MGRPKVLLGALLTAPLLAQAASAQIDCLEQNYCQVTPNSTGFPALISSNGNCVLEDNDYRLRAEPVPNSGFGIFFYAPNPSGGGAGIPFGNGWRCAGAPGDSLARLDIEPISNNQLEHTLDVNDPPLPVSMITVGSTWFFQAWFRDPAAGGSNFNTSDGLQVTFAERPKDDIVVVLLDDIGFEYLRTYDDQNAFDGASPFNVQEDPAGQNLYPWTPTFAALADAGVRFNQFHCNPTCSTTRAALYTGRYAFRNGVGSLVNPDRVGSLGEFGIGANNDEFTLAQVMQNAGYRTSFVGKHHLSIADDQLTLGGQLGYGWEHALDYLHWEDLWLTFANMDVHPTPPALHVPGVSGSLDPSDDVGPGYFNYYSWTNFGNESWFSVNSNTTYTTERMREKMAELDLHLGQVAPGMPRLTVLSYNSAHTPYGDFPDTNWLATQEYWPATTQWGQTIPGGSGSETAWTGHCVLIEALDNRLNALFDDLGGLAQVLATKTVFIVGDNGAPNPTIGSAEVFHGKDIGSVYTNIWANGSNHFKHQPYEQGTKVPLIVAGTGVRNPGRISNAPLDIVDVHATIVQLGGGEVTNVVTDGRPYDGRSFLSLLEDTRTDEEHIDEVRDFCFVERFSPNGDPTQIAPPIDNLNSRRRGMMARTANGWFKIIRRLGDSGLEEDEFYQLYSGTVPSSASAVDPHELTDIFGDPTYLSDFVEVRDRLEQLLATEP